MRILHLIPSIDVRAGGPITALIGVGALALQLLLAWLGSELFELDGLAIALALSTLFVLAGILRELDALGAAMRGIAGAALALAAVTLVAYLPLGLALGSVAAALVGLVVYVVLVALWRPAGLTRSWSYLRALR